MVVGLIRKKDRKTFRGECKEETLVFSGNSSHTWTCVTKEGESYSVRANDFLILLCEKCKKEFTLGKKALLRTLEKYTERDLCERCRICETRHQQPRFDAVPWRGRRTHSREELCKLRSENAKKLNTDPTYKKKLSEASKQKWKDPVFVKKWKKSHSKAMKKETTRAKMSLATHEKWKDEDYRKKMSQHRYRISKFQREVFESYKKKDERWELEKPIKGTYYTADLYNDATKEIVECYGDYWHCNPKRFDETFYHKHTHRTAKETWTFDADRTKVLEALGYKVKIVWESDWKGDINEIQTGNARHGYRA